MAPFSTGVDLHKLNRQKNKKIFDWEKHHQYYIEQWELLYDNVDENNEPHMNREYRRYQAWYQHVTRCSLWLQWIEDDYANIKSSDDEDMAYDQTTHVGRQVEAGQILDKVGNTLKCSVEDIECFRPRVRDDDTRSFLDRLSRQLRRAAARCGCRTTTTQDMHVPSTGRGGLGSSSQAPIGSIGIAYEDEDEDDDEVDQRNEELGPSQLQDAPSTQPTQPSGTRRRRPPNPYTSGTDALGHEGKGKTRRQ